MVSIEKIFEKNNRLLILIMIVVERLITKLPLFPFWSLSGIDITLIILYNIYLFIFLKAYRMTEVGWAAMVYLSESKSLSNYKTVGRPVAGTEIKVIDSEGKSLPFNSIGEICIRGDQVSPGYLNTDKENQNTFTSDGFLRTGDTGYYDREGLFYIVGRYKEMIKVEGILKFKFSRKFLHKFFKFSFKNFYRLKDFLNLNLKVLIIRLMERKCLYSMFRKKLLLN